MKKIFILLVAMGMTVSTGAVSASCDTRICFSSYLDCLNQGLNSTLCFQAYITCRDSGCNPV